MASLRVSLCTPKIELSLQFGIDMTRVLTCISGTMHVCRASLLLTLALQTARGPARCRLLPTRCRCATCVARLLLLGHAAALLWATQPRLHHRRPLCRRLIICHWLWGGCPLQMAAHC